MLNEEEFSKRKRILTLIGLGLAGMTPQITAGASTTLLPTALTQYGRMALYSGILICNTAGMASFAPIAGRLSDILGSKKTLIFGLVVYFCSMAAIFVGGNVLTLAVGLFFAGVGYGAINSCVKSSVGEYYDEKDQDRFLGYIETASDGGMFFAPLLGGVITDTIGWHYVYAFTFATSLIAFLLILFNAPKSKVKNIVDYIDYKGLVTFFFMALSLMMMISGTGNLFQKGSAIHYTVIAVCVISVILFLLFERNNDNAFINFVLFKNKLFILLFFSCLSLNLTYVALSYSSFYFQNICGYSATMAGTLQTPRGVVGIFVGLVVGLIASKTGKYKQIYIFQLFLITISYLVMMLSTPYTAWIYVVGSVIFSIGMGAVMLCPVSMCLRYIGKKLSGVAIGLVTFTVTFGSTVSSGLGGRFVAGAWSKAATMIPEAMKTALGDDNYAYMLSQSALRDGNKLSEIQNALPVEMQVQFEQLVHDLRMLMMSGIRKIFIYCLVCMAISITIAFMIKLPKDPRTETVK